MEESDILKLAYSILVVKNQETLILFEHLFLTESGKAVNHQHIWISESASEGIHFLDDMIYNHLLPQLVIYTCLSTTLTAVCSGPRALS